MPDQVKPSFISNSDEMKKFLYNILLFVCPACILLSIGDYFYSLKSQESNLYNLESWYDLMHGKIDADIIVMGNSRAFVQIDPIVLDSALSTTSYNLAIDGSSINRQIEKYNVFRKYNRKPRVILQNIDHITLLHVVGYEREQLFPYFWDKNIRSEFFSTEPFSIWEKYMPFYRYYHNLGRNQIIGLITYRTRRQTKGYLGKIKTWDGSNFRKVDSINYRANDRSLAMFDDYLAKAKAEGIEVVFVHTPIYIGLTKKLVNSKEMLDKYKEFADKYNIPILDYRDLYLCFDTTYFYNAMHLNKIGAEIFSDTLACDIKRLGIL